MDALWGWLPDWVDAGQAWNYVKAAIVLIGAYLLSRSLRARLSASTRMGAQQIVLARALVGAGVMVFATVWAFTILGFDLGPLLGAAGVMTVALGFAAQTSVSNLISGLFLMAERPFVVGDVVRLGATTGEVIDVNLMSLRLRTFDNLMVRVPNETVLKSEVTNLTHFPIRRLDMQIGVAYKENVSRVREILDKVADRNPICLDEPKPVFIFLGYGESALTLQFSVWTARENFLELRNTMHEQVKGAFDEEGIEIPFPHRTLYAGSETAPLPVRVVASTPPPE